MCSWLLGARLVSLLGMLVSGLCLLPVIIIHVTDRDHSLLVVPLLISLRDTALGAYKQLRITEAGLETLEHRIAVIGDHGIVFSLALFIWNSLNIILDLMLMVGASCGVRCLFLPWLAVSLLQLVVVGCLTVLVTAYTSLCLLLQGALVTSLVITFLPTLAVLGLLGLWLIVLAGYRHLGKTRVAKCTGTSCEGSSSDDAGCLGENLVTNSPSYRHAPAQYTQFYGARHRHTRPMGPVDLTLYPTLPTD